MRAMMVGAALALAAVPEASARMTETELMLAMQDCGNGDAEACAAMHLGMDFPMVADPASIVPALREAEADCAAGALPRCADAAQYLQAIGDRGDPRIYDYFAQACDGGDGWACGRLGDLALDLAQGETDARYTAYYSERSDTCRAGDRDACVTMARLNALLTSVRPEREVWLDPLAEACAADHARACTILSYIWSDDGVEEYRRFAPDLRALNRLAYRMAVRACEGGNPVGCWNAGLGRDDGRGARKSWYEANRFFARACAGGLSWGCEELNYESYWRPEDPMSELVPACEIGDFNACLFIAQRRHAPIVIGQLSAADLARMERYAAEMVEICQMGSHRACSVAAAVMKRSLGDRDGAERYGTLACQLLDGNGCVVVGNLWRERTDVADRYVRARGFFELACEYGSWVGCNNLGNDYAKGLSGAPDPAKAAHYLSIACTNGFALSCDHLGRVLRDTDPDAADAAAARACALDPPSYCE